MFFRQIKNIISAIILLIGTLLFPQFSHAADASLYISPSSVSTGIGGIFTVSVLLASNAQSANATSFVATFPNDKLEVTSVNKTGIISLWVQDPTFSNTAGTVSGEGVIFNPGYQGGGAKIMSITFRAKNSGSAKISFASGSILANDGSGTAIPTALGSSTITISSTTTPTTSTDLTNVAGTNGKPQLPTIFSDTHPDSEKWYRQNYAHFTWDMADEMTDVSAALDRSPTTRIGTQSIGRLQSFSSSDIGEDGIWYFHLRTKNILGWSNTAHFAFRVDSEPPSKLTISRVYEDTLINRARFNLEASDATSGIDKYLVTIDKKYSTELNGNITQTFETENLTGGIHTLTVRAFDKAGNYKEERIYFNIDGQQAPNTLTSIAQFLVIFMSLLAIITMLMYIFEKFTGHPMFSKAKHHALYGRKSISNAEAEHEMEKIKAMLERLNNLGHDTEETLKNFQKEIKKSKQKKK
jgi:hypothetical protein